MSEQETVNIEVSTGEAKDNGRHPSKADEAEADVSTSTYSNFLV
jgi:hypothetical protein